MDAKADASFDEITVKRINIVDPDGKLRVAIAGKSRLPDPVMDGRVLASRADHPSAGLIFFNNDGDECGGYIYSGSMTPDGPEASGVLTFDQFQNDQVLFLSFNQQGERRNYGLHVQDRPTSPTLTELVDGHTALQAAADGPEKDAALEKLKEGFPRQRIFAGRNEGGQAVVLLCDGDGKPRMRLVVDADGDPRIQFLDADGNVTFKLPPD